MKPQNYKLDRRQGKIPISTALAALTLSGIIFAAPWATYTQLSLATTPITILIVILIISVITGAISNHAEFNLQKIDNMLLLFIFFVYLSFFYSMYSASWAVTAFWYTACALTYASVKSFCTKKEYLDIFSYAAIAGIAVTFTLIDLRVDQDAFKAYRYSVPNHNGNFTAYCLCALVFIILSNLTLNILSKFKIALSHLSILISLYEVFLLDCRGAQISIFIMILIYVFRRIFINGLYRIFVLSSLFLSALVIFGLGDGFLSTIDNLSERGDGELSGRMGAWNAARMLIIDHPLLGIGTGAFQFVNPSQIGVHNTVLELALDAGILGAVTLIVWAVVNFVNIRLNEPRKSQFAVLWMAYALPISLSGEWLLSPLVWVTFGILFGIREQQKPLGELR